MESGEQGRDFAKGAGLLLPRVLLSTQVNSHILAKNCIIGDFIYIIIMVLLKGGHHSNPIAV